MLSGASHFRVAKSSASAPGPARIADKHRKGGGCVDCVGEMRFFRYFLLREKLRVLLFR